MAVKFLNSIALPVGTPAAGKVWTATDAVGNANWAVIMANAITRLITPVSVNTAAGSTALTDYEYICTAAITITLPTAVSNTNLYTVMSTDGLTTVTTTGGQTINGSTTVTLPIANMSLDFTSNGSNWVIN